MLMAPGERGWGMAEARSARRIVYSVLTIVRAGHNEQVRLGFSDGSDVVLVLADDAVLNSFDFPEVVTTSAPSPTPPLRGILNPGSLSRVGIDRLTTTMHSFLAFPIHASSRPPGLTSAWVPRAGYIAYCPAAQVSRTALRALAPA